MHPVARVGLILIAVIAGFTAVNGVVSADRSTVDPSNSQAARYGLVGAGSYTTCAVNNGDIYCSGRMSYSFSTASMTQITLNSSAFRPGTVLDLAVGGPMIFEQTACVVATDGTTVVGGVWCWGSNYRGQFGNNTIDQYDGEQNPPTRAFGNLTGATQVAVGDMHVCVLKSDTTVVCAGTNSSGQLGDNSTTSSRTPVTVVTSSGTLTGVTAISSAGSTTCAIAPNGSVTGAIWCWGDNTYGQLGRGSTGGNSLVAATVLDGGGSTGIDVGGATICSTGVYGARCWGQNFTTWSDIDTPRLGINPAFDFDSAVAQAFPVEVIAFTPIAVATSLVSTCALSPDGEVWCWGDNRSTLGDGTTTDSASAVRVLLPTSVDVLSSGYAHFCAANRVGQMWCWGEGGQFQLGNGSGANRSTPTAVSGRTLDWTYNGTAPTTTAIAPGVGIATAVTLDETITPPTTRSDAGDAATVTHTITNTGNVTLTTLTVTDTLVPDSAITCTGGSGNVVTTLAPAASTTCTTTRTLSQADIDSGSVASSAIVSAGSHSASATDTDTLTITRTAAHDITTTIGTITDTDNPTDGAGDAGDTAAITHTVTNTGNVTLTDLTVTDTLVPSNAITCTGGTGNAITTLAPGASTTCSATHTLTAGEVAAGSITSAASLVSTAPSGVTAASTATATDIRSFTPNTTTTTTTTIAATTTSTTTTPTPTTGPTTSTTASNPTASNPTTTTTDTAAQTATGTPSPADLADLADSLERGTITRSIPMPGGTLELVGDGFTPGETVTAGLVSRRPKVLGTTTADQSGRATVTATIDLDQSGPATLILHGATSGHGIAQDITIGGALPTTGRRTTGADLVVLLAASGALLTLVARRRAWDLTATAA